MDDITTCYERGGQPEWDHNDYSRDFTYLGIDRSQPIALPLNERSQPMSGISEFVRGEEEAAEAIAEPTPQLQQIDIKELLFAIKSAAERMSNNNSHRGILVTAGSVIIHLFMENARLQELVNAAIAAGEAQTAAPTVTLT